MRQEGSISFLKKRNKKLLLVDADERSPWTEMSKSFLVLFFKKELLPWRLPSFCSESLSIRIGISLTLVILATAPRADGAASSDEWPYYGHDQLEQRYSPANEINQSTVGKLGLAWSQEVNSDRGQESTPIVANGVIYVSTAWSLVYAFDAATGKQLWLYDPKTPRDSLVSACCDAVNRGVAVHSGRVFVGTLDGRLVAIDAKTGKLAWQVDTLAGAPKTMRYTITGAVRVATKW
jgi:hypothetical protein